jgi:16S rRNA (cytosine967-C5)-methyltransferase
LGVDIVRRLQVDASRELTDLGTFDRVLLDAPCSGLGVLRRHPEGKWQKTEEALARHHAAQLNLLEQVCRVLRPAGVLVYSTCSTEAEENESVVERFCAAHREFSREPVSPWLPPSGRRLVTAQGDLSTMFSDRAMDGFFAARLRKAA